MDPILVLFRQAMHRTHPVWQSLPEALTDYRSIVAWLDTDEQEDGEEWLTTAVKTFARGLVITQEPPDLRLPDHWIIWQESSEQTDRCSPDVAYVVDQSLRLLAQGDGGCFSVPYKVPLL